MVEKQETEPEGLDEERHFIANMKRIREELGLSQGELAKLMESGGWKGFHQTTISRIEKGERPVRLSEARGLSKALGALVGQMILPPKESKSLRDLELAVMRTEQAGKNIGYSVGELLDSQFVLKLELEKARELSVDPSADEWVTERYSNVLEAAKRALDLTPGGEMKSFQADYYGVDPEAS